VQCYGSSMTVPDSMFSVSAKGMLCLQPLLKGGGGGRNGQRMEIALR